VRLQIAVRGGNNPDGGRDRLAADPLEGLLLKHPQHLRPEGEWHVADLVEEQGATVALFELADALAVGAGERAFLVTEQLAFQQVFRNRGAVQSQERRPVPPAVLVDRAGDPFLAGYTSGPVRSGRRGSSNTTSGGSS